MQTGHAATPCQYRPVVIPKRVPIVPLRAAFHMRIVPSCRELQSRARSPLQHFGFWRVCLDEAQLVAHTASAAALAASQLWRRHAWVVTGTPVSTHLKELQVRLRVGALSERPVRVLCHADSMQAQCKRRLHAVCVDACLKGCDTGTWPLFRCNMDAIPTLPVMTALPPPSTPHPQPTGFVHIS